MRYVNDYTGTYHKTKIPEYTDPETGYITIYEDDNTSFIKDPKTNITTNTYSNAIKLVNELKINIETLKDSFNNLNSIDTRINVEQEKDKIHYQIQMVDDLKTIISQSNELIGESNKLINLVKPPSLLLRTQKYLLGKGGKKTHRNTHKRKHNKRNTVGRRHK